VSGQTSTRSVCVDQITTDPSLRAGNIYHNWPKALTLVTGSVNHPLKEGVNSTIALQRYDPRQPPTVTIRYVDKAFPSLGDQVFRRQIENDDKVQLMARARVTLQVKNRDPMSGLGTMRKFGVDTYRWVMQMEDDEDAKELFDKWSAIIADRGRVGQMRPVEREGMKRKRQDTPRDEEATLPKERAGSDRAAAKRAKTALQDQEMEDEDEEGHEYEEGDEDVEMRSQQVDPEIGVGEQQKDPGVRAGHTENGSGERQDEEAAQTDAEMKVEEFSRGIGLKKASIAQSGGSLDDPLHLDDDSEDSGCC
jgi:hypothetical protein